MKCIGLPRLMFLSLSILAVAMALLAQRPSTIPGAEQGRQTMKRAGQSVDQDRLAPAQPTPDWEKARADAARLLALAQKIHEEVEAARGRLPATLPGELKETEKLAKRIRTDLRF